MKTKEHTRFLGDVTFCPKKGGRCKVTADGKCSNCGDGVRPWSVK